MHFLCCVPPFYSVTGVLPMWSICNPSMYWHSLRQVLFTHDCSIFCTHFRLRNTRCVVSRVLSCQLSHHKAKLIRYGILLPSQIYSFAYLLEVQWYWAVCLSRISCRCIFLYVCLFVCLFVCLLILIVAIA